MLWPPWAKNHCWPRRLILGFQTILADTAHELAQSLLYRLFKAMGPKQGDLRMQWLNTVGLVHPTERIREILQSVSSVLHLRVMYNDSKDLWHFRIFDVFPWVSHSV